MYFRHHISNITNTLNSVQTNYKYETSFRKCTLKQENKNYQLHINFILRKKCKPNYEVFHLFSVYFGDLKLFISCRN